MRIVRNHCWDLAPRDAMALQTRLAARAAHHAPVAPDFLASIQFVLGLDVAYSQPTRRCYAAAVVLAFPSLEVVEERVGAAPATYPYVPGLLTFRELPALRKVLARVRLKPDVILCDGQGIAHPRRMGLAAHIGYLYDTPSVGCAKSRLIGTHETPRAERGSRADLMDNETKIGEALRTRDNTNPLFVSPGFRMTFELAREITLRCAPNYRMPEPTRLAHRATTQLYRQTEFPAKGLIEAT